MIVASRIYAATCTKLFVYLFWVAFIPGVGEETSSESKKEVDGSNISKTSASVSSGFQTREKLMKARGRRPSAFIVFECLKPR